MNNTANTACHENLTKGMFTIAMKMFYFIFVSFIAVVQTPLS